MLPAFDFAERVTHLAASVRSPLQCLLRTMHRSTLCSSRGRGAGATTKPVSKQVSRPRRPSTAAARQVALAEKGAATLNGRSTTFQRYVWAPGADLSPPTHAHTWPHAYKGKGTQLTSPGRVCLPKPTRCWAEEQRKCRSSSVAIPLPHLGKEQRAVISALGDAQGCYPERKTPHSCLPRREAQGNPGESPPLLGRSPTRTQHKSRQRPQASDGCGRQSSPGLHRSLVRLQH